MSEVQIERRPGAGGASNSTFPAEWGRPPAEKEARRAWIVMNVRLGEQRRERGERVHWLAAETR